MGLFKIRRSDGKLTLQLKGDFDAENIDWHTQLTKKRRFFCCKIFELDMSEVGTLSSEALSHLFNFPISISQWTIYPKYATIRNPPDNVERNPLLTPYYFNLP